jgi:hypothetical protein
VRTINEELEPKGWRSALLWVLTFAMPILVGLLILAVAAVLAYVLLIWREGGTL